MKFDPQRCGQLGILARGARETAQGFDRLCSLAERFGWDWQPVDFKARREAVGHAMLASFSDQLAIRFNQGTLACRLVGNRRGKLDEESCVKNAPAFVAAEITEVEAREVITHLRRATAIDPAWLADLFPDDLTHHRRRGMGRNPPPRGLPQGNPLPRSGAGGEGERPERQPRPSRGNPRGHAFYQANWS